MKAGIQRIFEHIGESGCFALCIIEAPQRGRPEQDAVNIILKARTLGVLEEDMTVVDSIIDGVRYSNLMTMASGGARWTQAIKGPDYIAQAGELIVEHWKYIDKEGQEHTHFMLHDWDPLGDSQTAKFGRCYEKRVFRRVI